MVMLWLIVWLLSGAPKLAEWNKWLVSLIICASDSLLHLVRHHRHDH